MFMVETPGAGTVGVEGNRKRTLDASGSAPSVQRSNGGRVERTLLRPSDQEVHKKPGLHQRSRCNIVGTASGILLMGSQLIDRESTLGWSQPLGICCIRLPTIEDRGRHRRTRL